MIVPIDHRWMVRWFIFLYAMCPGNMISEFLGARMLQQMQSELPSISPALASWYTTKKVLVTGGAGFIGSHLVQTLVHCGAHVTVLDDLSTGSQENIAAVVSHITFITGSITDPALCALACQGQDIVFHLAAVVSVTDSVANPLHCNEVNTQGTLNILQAARTADCTSFILSSSAAVYGNKEGAAYEDDVCTPTSMYGLSKLMGEHYCRLYATSYGIGTVCLRYFNVYGPRQRADSPYSGVIARFMDRLRANQPITIFGDGNQTRDFVPVQVVVHANLAAGALAKKQQQGQAINIGLGKQLSINALIEILRADFPQYNAAISHEEARPGDIRHSIAHTERYTELCKNTGNLSTGIGLQDLTKQEQYVANQPLMMPTRGSHRPTTQETQE